MGFLMLVHVCAARRGTIRSTTTHLQRVDAAWMTIDRRYDHNWSQDPVLRGEIKLPHLEHYGGRCIFKIWASHRDPVQRPPFLYLSTRRHGIAGWCFASVPPSRAFYILQVKFVDAKKKKEIFFSRTPANARAQCTIQRVASTRHAVCFSFCAFCLATRSSTTGASPAGVPTRRSRSGAEFSH